MDRNEIIDWLTEENPERLTRLWARADRVRRRHVGDEVHLRGLVEVSSHCVRRCAYCGLSAENRELSRYRMTAEEVLASAHDAVRYGYGTVVLQAGEDPELTGKWVAELVRRIKAETPLAITLSLGERSDDELAVWRQAGADRYLLRFETSDPVLYARVHPPRPGTRSDRIAILRTLRRLGYEVGSGVMIGIPGQTYGSLADDVMLFSELDPDMIGVGPFIPHPGTPLGQTQEQLGADQAPNTELMTYKVVALARLICPNANIPSTTALATLNPHRGRELGLKRGANVVMPNVTPTRYRRLYEIYPAKACIAETASQCHLCLEGRIASLGRTIGVGRGDSRRYHEMVKARSGGPGVVR